MSAKVNKSNKILKLVAICLCIALLGGYFVYQTTMFLDDSYTTELAFDSYVYNTVDARAFVLRDEQYINASTSGTLVTMVENGEKVSGGDTVAVIFDSDTAAQNYLKKNEISEEIERYRSLAGQADIQAMDVSAINIRIKKACNQLLNTVDSGKLQSIKEDSNELRDSITTLQISTGAVFDYSEKIAALESELAALSSSSGLSGTINAPESGFYISGADGYENTLSYDNLDEITLSDLDAALNSQPAAVGADVRGRLVSGFKWYILCETESKYFGDTENGDSVYIDIPKMGISKLKTEVHSFSEKSSDKILLVLECALVNSLYTDLRIEDIKIIVDEYEGLKIPKEAIRTVKDEEGVDKQGVYVFMGNIVYFKKVDIIYSTDEYIISDNSENSSNYVKLYDEVIIKGVDLYDGKLVPRS